MSGDVENFECCVCGGMAYDEVNYVRLELRSRWNESRQWLGAHASCLNSVFYRRDIVMVHED